MLIKNEQNLKIPPGPGARTLHAHSVCQAQKLWSPRKAAPPFLLSPPPATSSSSSSYIYIYK